jgi:hypothetical protein
MKKADNLKLGLALGFILPIAIFFLIYLLRFSYYPLGDFFSTIRQESRLITFFAAWCIVANIGLFTLFINTRRDQSAKGVFILTVVYGILFLLLRWLM